MFLAGAASPAQAQSDDLRGLAQQLAVLKQQVAEQQAQIDKLRGMLERQQERLSRAAGAERSESGAARPLMLAAASAPAEGSPQAQGEFQAPAAGEASVSPLSFRIGSADFTPGGFMDFTSIFRSTNAGCGIGTSFGAIPFSNTPAGRLSEERLTIQNSRLSLKVTAKVGAQNVTGYVETDFLGQQPGNGFVTSNSNSLRSRLYWLDVQRGKFEFLGGQSWSMLTPNRKGISPNPPDLFHSQNMDTNYQVGLTWARQAQFRMVYHPSSQWAAGVSFENPQQYIGSAVVLPSSAFAAQLDNGANPGAPNLHPDVIAKVAFDGERGGRTIHLEAAGLLRSFRLFNPATGARYTATGGGGSLNALVELARNFRLVATTFYSDGGGRYIFGLGPDLVVRPDGRPSLVHSASGIGGFEYQTTPRTMYYGYYGGAYFQRNFSGPAGFGFAGSPSSANRALQEATFGLIQTFWKEQRYGALQLITQYSYVLRNPWSAEASARSAHTNMVYLDLRYVIP
jgi:hypothetical protein